MIPCIENSWSYASGREHALVGPRELHAHRQRLEPPASRRRRARSPGSGRRSACGRPSRARPRAPPGSRPGSLAAARRSTIAISAGSPGTRAATAARGRSGSVAGMLVAGLDVLRIEDPAGEIALRVRDRRRSERRAGSRDASDPGPTVPARVRAGDRVAIHAGRAEEHLLASLERRRSPGGGAGRASRASHASNCALRLGDDVERHVRVLRRRRTRRTGRGRRPHVGASQTTSFVWPGIMSIFRFSSGTQRLWITSRARRPGRRPARRPGCGSRSPCGRPCAG